MKRALIIHGWEGSPEGNWFPWLKKELENRDYSVQVPAMPNSEHPQRDEWLKTIQDLLPDPDEDTAIIGHSLGCITALQYLEKLDDRYKVGKVILVSGFIRALHNPETDGFFAQQVSADLIKDQVDTIVAISSDNDPYVSFSETQFLCNFLNIKPLILTGAGHINAESGYRELPQILTYIP